MKILTILRINLFNQSKYYSIKKVKYKKLTQKGLSHCLPIVCWIFMFFVRGPAAKPFLLGKQPNFNKY